MKPEDAGWYKLDGEWAWGTSRDAYLAKEVAERAKQKMDAAAPDPKVPPLQWDPPTSNNQRLSLRRDFGGPALDE